VGADLTNQVEREFQFRNVLDTASQSYAWDRRTNVNIITSSHYLSYTKMLFDSTHQLTAIGGFELTDRKQEGVGLLGVGFPNDYFNRPGYAVLKSQGSYNYVTASGFLSYFVRGIYKIKDSIALLEELDNNISQKKTTHNEFTLTDAMMNMMEKGYQFKSFDVANWFDCGKKDILLETNSTLLKRLNYDTTKYKFENTIIIPPVFIGDDCKISNCIIGPNVSIGESAILNYAIVKESIIGPFAQIEYAILEKSLIGNDATLCGNKQSLNIGDSTEINFG
jgi:hypothetical protein